MAYEKLREEALANFELLLTYWEIDYVKVNNKEYDFINPLREDHNHGACRFNVDKGTGADFAGATFKDSDFLRLGPGFNASDFAGVTKTGNWGFDIIGLCERLHGLKSRDNSSKLLAATIKEIKKSPGFIKPASNAIERREHKRQEDNLKRLKNANNIWKYGSPFKDSLADIYFQSRGIHVKNEPNIKFHPRVYNLELEAFIPAVLFKVQTDPDGPLVAVHRIYIAKDGSRKANLDDPKKAIGLIKGAGIWFGKKDDTLSIAEGQENALSIHCLGYGFTVSTINATNFSNLVVPNYVRKVILFPDQDKAGKEAAHKALKAYQQQQKEVAIVFPPDNYKGDWNDYIRGINV